MLFTSGSFRQSLGNLGRLTEDMIEQGGPVSKIKMKHFMFELHYPVVQLSFEHFATIIGAFVLMKERIGRSNQVVSNKERTSACSAKPPPFQLHSVSQAST